MKKIIFKEKSQVQHEHYTHTAPDIPSSTILLLRKRKLRHSLGRPSRSDFLQLMFFEQNNE